MKDVPKVKCVSKNQRTYSRLNGHMSACYCGFVLVQQQHFLPLDKYPSLHGVDDAAEARFLLIASQHQAHLASEGGGQPVPHFRGYRLWLDVAELILCVNQAPEKEGWQEKEQV